MHGVFSQVRGLNGSILSVVLEQVWISELGSAPRRPCHVSASLLPPASVSPLVLFPWGSLFIRAWEELLQVVCSILWCQSDHDLLQGWVCMYLLSQHLLVTSYPLMVFLFPSKGAWTGSLHLQQPAGRDPDHAQQRSDAQHRVWWFWRSLHYSAVAFLHAKGNSWPCRRARFSCACMVPGKVV